MLQYNHYSSWPLHWNMPEVGKPTEWPRKLVSKHKCTLLADSELTAGSLMGLLEHRECGSCTKSPTLSHQARTPDVHETNQLHSIHCWYTVYNCAIDSYRHAQCTVKLCMSLGIHYSFNAQDALQWIHNSVCNPSGTLGTLDDYTMPILQTRASLHNTTSFHYTWRQRP
jgi:hypothetical protein